MAQEASVTVYGAFWCPDCKRSKKFLGEQMIAYRWVDIEQDQEARLLVEAMNGGKRIIPTILFSDGSHLVEPSNAELAAKLGLQTRARREFYDLIVIGGGVTGLTTALYAAREGLETLVIEKSGIGGQAAITEKVENYPGFPDGIGGSELTERITQQVRRFGVEILQAQEVSEIQRQDPYRTVKTADGSMYSSYAVVVATGAEYRRLNVPGEDDFIGSGIHFCATCDGPFYKGADQLLVIGGGNAAVEEGLFLLKFAKRVTLVVRGGELSASAVARDKALSEPGMEVLFNTSVQEFRGDGKLNNVVVRNRQTGERQELHPAAVFVFVGQSPNSAVVRGLVELDGFGYIRTGHALLHALDDPMGARAWPQRAPFAMETSLPGIFAAGDVREGATAQIASAVGEGASAALSIREYLKMR